MFAVTLATALAAAAWARLLALWREKTFQTLALTVLALRVLAGRRRGRRARRGGRGLGGHRDERVGRGIQPLAGDPRRRAPAGRSPRRLCPGSATPINLFLLFSLALCGLLNATAIGLVRVWNPSREARASHATADEPESIWGLTEEAAAAAAGRRANRPFRGRKDAPRVGQPDHLARDRHLGLRPPGAGDSRGVSGSGWFAAVALRGMIQSEAGLSTASAALVLVPLFVLSLVLVNAQAVTSLTSERDVRGLDLLLVTDLTPKEFVFGKLGGVFYNTKEMVLLPMALCGYLWFERTLSGENLLYLLGGLAVMNVFVAMLGVHAGMTYANSRTAIGVSLGTVFFLFVGVATCMRMMIAFSGSFHWQIQPFLAFMLGGGVGLYAALGSRNPSAAIGVASVLAPIATF